MYGSSFQLEQSLTAKNHSSTETKNITKAERVFIATFLAVLFISISTAAFAGPSQPRLPNGNGDSRGR